MKAGRDLDKLVADMLGWSCLAFHNEYILGSPQPCEHWPHYSTDISEAFHVVDALMKMEKYYVNFHLTDDCHSSTACFAEENDHDWLWYCTFCLGQGRVGAGADTLPLAICLAALKAKEIEIKEPQS